MEGENDELLFEPFGGEADTEGEKKVVVTRSFTHAEKLRFSTAAKLAVLVMLYAFFHSQGGQRHIENFGPQDDFVVLDVVINTWPKYMAIMMIVAVTEVVMVLDKQIAAPIIKFYVYNPHVDKIEWMLRGELEFLCNSTSSMEMLIELIVLMMMLTKLDILLFGVFVRMATRIFTIHYQTSSKQFATTN